MLIDFTSLMNLIPDNGSISLTVKKNKDGKLGVLFKSNHSLIKKDSSYSNDKEVKETSDVIDKSSKELDKVLAFAEMPEVLTATFEEMITRKFNTEKNLADVINESTAALNERLKELKNKKTTPKTTAKKGDTTEEKKAGESTNVIEGGLFGSVTKSADAGSGPDVSSDLCDTGQCDAEKAEPEAEELKEVA